MALVDVRPQSYCRSMNIGLFYLFLKFYTNKSKDNWFYSKVVDFLIKNISFPWKYLGTD